MLDGKGQGRATMTKPSIIVRLAGPGAEKSLPLFQSDAFELTTAPVDPASPARKVLVAFRPPRDEDLSIYEWVHVAGAGSDKVAAALQADGADPLMTRTVGRMGEQIGEYVLSYILADLQRHTERQRLQAEGEWSIAKAEGRASPPSWPGGWKPVRTTPEQASPT